MWEAIRVVLSRICGLFGQRRSEDAFDEEAASHLDLLTERFVLQGMTPHEALAAAKRQFGGLTQLQESLRDQRSYPFVDSLRRDAVLAFRQIRTAPRFTAVAALALGLGIGASTAMFSIINAVLLRPLPYPDDDRLVWAGEVMKGSSTDEVTLTPDFLEWRRQNRVFSGMAAYNTVLRTLIANGEAIQLRTVKASAALLPTPGPLILPLDFRVLGFAALSAFVCAMLFGLGPALMSAGISKGVPSRTDGARACG